MTTYSNNKPPIWFWIISIVALVWNLMGVSAYLFRAYVTDDIIAELPPKQQAEMLYEHPAWYTSIFALAVFCGALGCIALLMRKKWAYYLFIISFICATIQQVYLMIEVEGMNKFMPIMIIIVCMFLVWFTKMATSKEWIK